MGNAVRNRLSNARTFVVTLGRRTVADRSATVLVAANLLVAALIVLMEGDAASLLFVYWVETMIIGVMSIVKMYLVPPRTGTRLDPYPIVKWTLALLGRTLLALLFVLHYGLFALVTGVLILGLGAWGFSPETDPTPPFGDVLRLHLWPVSLIAVSHVWSLVTNYIGRKEYRSRDTNDLMGRPYKRLALMIVVVWPGMIFASKTNTPMAVIALVFVPLKIILDLVAHFRDHKELESV